MKYIPLIFIPFVILSSSTQIALAQDFFIFPSQGQSEEQQERDEVECQIWARQQTGFDPLATPTSTAPPPSREARQGGLFRGGARGGAIGAVAGAIGGNAGRGAATGAATGALIGGMRRSDQARRQEEVQSQWSQQQEAEQFRDRERFNLAFKTCLQGKGYTVNF